MLVSRHPTPLLLGVPAAAALMGIGQTMMRALVYEREVDALWLGTRIFVTVQSLLAFIARQPRVTRDNSPKRPVSRKRPTPPKCTTSRKRPTPSKRTASRKRPTHRPLSPPRRRSRR